MGVTDSNLYNSSLPEVFGGNTRCCPVALNRRFDNCVSTIKSNISSLRPNSTITYIPLLPYFAYPRYLGKFCSRYTGCSFVNSQHSNKFTRCVIIGQGGIFTLPASVPVRSKTFVRPVAINLRTFRLTRNYRGGGIVVVNTKAVNLLTVRYTITLKTGDIATVSVDSRGLTLTGSFNTVRAFGDDRVDTPRVRDILHRLHFGRLVLRATNMPRAIRLTMRVTNPRTRLTLINALRRSLRLASTAFNGVLHGRLAIVND